MKSTTTQVYLPRRVPTILRDFQRVQKQRHCRCFGGGELKKYVVFVLNVERWRMSRRRVCVLLCVSRRTWMKSNLQTLIKNIRGVVKLIFLGNFQFMDTVQ